MLDEKILKILRNSSEGHVSGEDLCRQAGVSRAAIWKHIERLRKDGYDIEAAPHLGYRLKGVADALIPEEIKWDLHTKFLGKEIISYKKIASTNTAAYSMAEAGSKEGFVVLAEEQAKGRGRHGRSWASPAKGGVYMSIVLRPDVAPNEIPAITLLAAVSVASAIRGVSGLDALIKWPNDILINSRKVCGILTEMKAEQDTVGFVIIGIGVNVNTPLKLLPKGASSLKEESGVEGREENLSRTGIVKAILEGLEKNYNLMRAEGFAPIVEKWKDLSAMLGARIKVTLQNRTFEGLAHDMDTDGSLMVRLDSGVIEKVSSGDIVMVR